jgi:phosphoserine phosphatase
LPATFHETVNEFEEELLPVVANRLFVFDMDGTLLIRTTACIEIAKVSGTLDHLHILEQQFAAGEMDAFSFAQSVGGLWGVVDEQLVRTAFEAPKLANIKKSRLSYGNREANPRPTSIHSDA